jgi:Thioredoxin
VRFAPAFDALAARYPAATWCKVWEHSCRELIMSCGVRAFPTLHLYLGGRKVDEMSGARASVLEAKVQHWCVPYHGCVSQVQHMGACVGRLLWRCFLATSGHFSLRPAAPLRWRMQICVNASALVLL